MPASTAALLAMPKQRTSQLTDDDYYDFLVHLDNVEKDHEGISDKAFIEETFTKFASQPAEQDKSAKSEVSDQTLAEEDDSKIMDKLVGADQPMLTREKAYQALNEVLDAWNVMPDDKELERLQSDHIDFAFKLYVNESADADGRMNRLFASEFVRDSLRLNKEDERQMQNRAKRESEKHTAALLQQEDDLE